MTGTRDQEGVKGMRTAPAGSGGAKRRAVDEASALAGLELAWAHGGYHGFSVDDGLWSAISSAGDVLTGDTPDALTKRIRAHWGAMQ
jgi:hypothetical protein